MTAQFASPTLRSDTAKNAEPTFSLLQRKRSCGGNAGFSGECESCRKKKLLGDIPPLVQPKLKIGAPNDRYEQEADRVADRVMRMPCQKIQRQIGPENEKDNPTTIQTKPLVTSITPLVQRQADQIELDEEDEAETIQPKRAPGHHAGHGLTVAPGTASRIRSLRGGGQPLDPATRSFMEPRFGRDFSNVRVHTGDEASSLARGINAKAFTLGNDVVFGSGEYIPQSTVGQKLLAHELTHVIQQTGTSYDRTPDKAITSSIGRASITHGLSHGNQTAVIRRYSHEDCSEKDLRNIVWPSDGIAKKMILRVIPFLLDKKRRTSKNGKALLKKYFRNPSPSSQDISTMLSVYRGILFGFVLNDYTYQCEEAGRCGENSRLGAWTCCAFCDIHLCMPALRKLGKNHCIAKIIIHEFGHRYPCLGDKEYCEVTSCDNATSPLHMQGCPDRLKPDDALKNNDSYASLAWGVHMLSL